MITMGLEEGDRQLILMALAHLAVEKPGFDMALNLIALRIDNNTEGRAKLYDEFRQLQENGLCPECHLPVPVCNSLTLYGRAVEHYRGHRLDAANDMSAEAQAERQRYMDRLRMLP